jgi:hypothetical protein
VTATASGTPTEIYTLVAGGILRCWFGADGPLQQSHIFHAEAAPPAQGGAAEIVLHERDPAQSDQRGPRAFRVMLTSNLQGTRLGILNIKLPPALANLLIEDVEVWAKDGKSCQAPRLKAPTPGLAPASLQPGRKTPKAAPN